MTPLQEAEEILQVAIRFLATAERSGAVTGLTKGDEQFLKVLSKNWPKRFEKLGSNTTDRGTKGWLEVALVAALIHWACKDQTDVTGN